MSESILGATTMSFGFIGLIILAALIVAAVFIIAKAGKKGFILIALCIVGVIFLVRLMSYRQARQYTTLQWTPDSQVYEQVEQQSAIWDQAVDQAFKSDQYACMEDAAGYLADKMADDVIQHQPRSHVLIYGQNPITIQTLNTFSDTLRNKLIPHIQDLNVETFTYQPQNLPNDPNTLICVLDTPQHNNKRTVINGVSLDKSHGILRLHVKQPNNTFIDRSANFQAKDWVKRLSSVQNTTNTPLLVVRSEESCMDESEARQQAMRSAANKLQYLLRQAKTDPAILDQEITVTPQDLMTHQFIADEFTQSFQTGVARVWRHAVLLNLNPHRLQSLLREKMGSVQQMHKSWAKDFMSLAGLALLVFILYIFLNAATKGYYAMPLRIMAFVLIAGVVVVLLLI